MNDFTSLPAPVGKRASDTPAVAPPTPGRDHALEQAIADDAIGVMFQPQIDPRTGRVTAVEALARWSGERGPEALFARAAACGLAERLSRNVQRKALRTVGHWDGPLSAIRLSINLIPDDLMRDGYVGWLLDEIKIAGLVPGRVTVEITESSLIDDQPKAAARLASLRAAGVQIAIDDFGTGYSSLAYLTTLPLDALKIDRAMIAQIVGGSRDRIVVRAMISLARELGLKVVVEGVESTAQLELVAGWGCDLYQGFLGAGALNEIELARFVDATMAEAA